MRNTVYISARHYMTSLCLVAALTAWSRAGAAEEVFISEFMASNSRTLADRDREFSDWIELHNGGSEPVNLAGWSLTDQPGQRSLWRFPETSIAPGGFLVVFASGKDRRLPGQELHTSFKLKADGGYLALVKPDGRTIASQFSPGYPPQSPDVSYGVSISDPSRVLVPATSGRRVLVPAAETDARWLQPDFDDSRWTAGQGGVGFDSANEFAGMLGTDVRQPMLGRNASAFVRALFELPDARFDSLKLRLRYDDGYVAYLNGKEIARRNAPAELRWNSSTAGEKKRPVTVYVAENFESAVPAFRVQEASPKMRPRANTDAGGGSGRFLRLVNGQTDNQVNALTLQRVVDSGNDPIVVDFDFRFKISSDAPARLSLMLLPVAAYPTNGPGVALDAFESRRHADFPGAFSVEIRPGHLRRTVCAHWDQSSRDDGGPVSSRFELPPRQFHHAQIQIKPGPKGAQLSVILSAAGGQKQTVIRDAFLPGMKLGPCRVEFAAQNGTWENTVDLANIRVQSGEGAGVKTEEIDLTDRIALLRPGRNVLAIHGLNGAADDRTFLIAPELFGRSSVGLTNVPGFFTQPTPRGQNRQVLPTVALPPVFTRTGGVYSNEVVVELKAKTGVVRFTLDGSEPTENSPQYSIPFRLTESALVKARTFAEGAVPSPSVVESFTVADDSAMSFASNLPLIIVNSHGRYLRQGSRATSFITVVDGGRRSTPGGPVDFHGAGEMNIRGYSSLRQPKHSYTFRARDDYGTKVKPSLLGMPKHSDWVLFAPYSDKTLMRDVLAYELSRKMGQYASRARFVEVFVANRGGKLSRRDYVGVYALMEKIERGKDRVDIQELTPSDNAEPNITGGYIFKRDHSDDDNPDFYTSRGSGMFMVEPNSRDITREQKAWIARYVNETERAIYGQNFRDPEKGYAAYLDVDSFIDQHWLIEMSKNIDGFRYSVFFCKDRGGKLKVQPVWDWNLSFGNANYHDGDDPRDWYTDRLRNSEISWFRRLNQDPEFAQRAIDRWGELRRDVFDVANIHRRMEEIATQLNEAQARNFQRWNIMGRSVWPNAYVGDSYREEVDWMKKWIRDRIAWIDSQLPPMPVLVSDGTSARRDDSIALRCARGKIYYTLDGTDPRKPGGAISPAAQIYKSVLPRASAAKLFARAFDGNVWSAPLRIPARGARAAR